LNDYDAKLDDYAKQTNVAEGALQTDDVYARLISAWSLREETIGKVKYFYMRANEIAHADVGNSKAERDRQDRALLMNRAIRNTVVSSANSTNRLAKQALLKELLEVQMNGTFRHQILDSAQETSSFYERNKNQLARETENSRKDDEITREIEARAPEVKAILAEQYEKRTPQSVGAYAPGLGRSGMLNGFEFKTGRWALTFDDGPHGSYTPQALANLKAADMKATFFWIAQNVMRYPSIVQQAGEAGHTLANHSFTHANLPKLGPAGLRHEIIESTTVDIQHGYRPRFFRCPYGACGSQTSDVRQKIASLGLVSVTWNVDSLDWQDKNPQSVYARVKKQMAVQKRGIILFHDIHPQSIAASKMIMADFAAGQKKGIYRTVTIDQAFDELNTAEGMK
jgi:peptidoglycan/xylan/chitin deacetylase (PgdA/CDA1 family)